MFAMDSSSERSTRWYAFERFLDEVNCMRVATSFSGRYASAADELSCLYRYLSSGSKHFTLRMLNLYKTGHPVVYTAIMQRIHGGCSLLVIGGVISSNLWQTHGFNDFRGLGCSLEWECCLKSW